MKKKKIQPFSYNIARIINPRLKFKLNVPPPPLFKSAITLSSQIMMKDESGVCFEEVELHSTSGSFWGGGDSYLARQPPILPSSRQTKGMDALQTEFLNLDHIKALNRKSQSTGGNVNELHDATVTGRDMLGRFGSKRRSWFLHRFSHFFVCLIFFF